MAIDTQNLYITLLRYNPNRLHPTLGGFDPQDMAAPANARDIKSYLRFNGQRDIIATSEGKATDVALNAAQTFCVQQKSRPIGRRRGGRLSKGGESRAIRCCGS